MDKLTDYLAKLWLKFDDDIDNLFKRRLLRTFNSTFLFLICFIALVGLIISFFASFNSIVDRVLFFIVFILASFIGFTYATTHLKRKDLKAKRLYPFIFKKLDFNLIDYNRLQLDREERIDFGLLLQRRKVQNKINFKEMNKS